MQKSGNVKKKLQKGLKSPNKIIENTDQTKGNTDQRL